MSEGGLDGLFGATAGPAQEKSPRIRRRRSPIVRVVGNLILVAAATVVVVAGLRAASVEAPLLLVIALVAGLRLVTIAAAAVRPPKQPKSRAGAGDAAARTADSLRATVRRWERSLDKAHSDSDTYARNVLPVLGELADERLRLRHGLTRTSDPRRARELLGEQAWAVLADPGRHGLKTRDLETYVQAMERL
ncbi:MULTISPECIES: hypothetical protein [Actinoplanes]|uniref:Uncharacterized protein n=2 Tax=Actinoplanes TaxID=1865 RepID=A0A0X3UVS0_9ACTN|nr:MULTISPECIES: hypothetical protein [Actinoplanes]KUL36648.1 hypothetical protein ADL15_12465 [Actinoplanes awajinensis subsp. mycoplanecinus]GIE66984.1 hypothetical protein Apa02nite_030920 [Actinoplanes palleronii]